MWPTKFFTKNSVIFPSNTVFSLSKKIFFTHCEQFGMEDLNPEDIEEALKFDEKDLSNEDLFELRNQMKSDEDEDVNDDSERPTELTSKLLKEIIENFQYACDFAKENDPNEVRSSKIIQSVLGDIKSYTEEAKEKLKQKNRQRIIDEYFSPK